MTGDLKDMIQHCVQQPPSVSYRNAKKLLDQKYGNSCNIMDVYREETETWSQIRNGVRKLSEVLKFFP